MPVSATCPLDGSSRSPQSMAATDETKCCINEDHIGKDAYSRESLVITYHNIPSQVGSVPMPSQVG